MLKMFAGGRGKSAQSASGGSFAHLIGLRPGAKKAEDDEACPPKGEEAEGDDEERKQREDETNDEYAKRMKKLDAKKGKDAKHDEPDGDEDENGNEPPDDENPDKDEDEDDDEEDAKKVKKAKAEGHGAIVSAARRMERRRIAKILNAPAAAKNVALAASLACETDLDPKSALSVLDKGAASGGLNARMNAAGSPRIGAGTAPSADANDPWAPIYAEYKSKRS